MGSEAAPQLHWYGGQLDADRLRTFGTDALLALPLRREDDDVALLADLSGVYGIDLTALAQRADAAGSAGAVTAVPLPEVAGSTWQDLPARLLLTGVGDACATSWRRAGAALARHAAGREHLVVAASPADSVGLDALATGVLLGSYRPPFTGTGPGPDAPVSRVTLAGAPYDDAEQAIDSARIGAEATILARTLAATPSNVKSPQWLAEQAQQHGKPVTGVTVTVHDEAWLAKHKMGGILAVGSASATPPRLVTVGYTPKGSRGRAPVVLVGKGITYDTGGISIKPREAMVPMKTDMSGAAVVLAAVLGAAKARVDRPVIAVLPLAENAVGADSYKPGDVLRMVDGTTVEIANTDAEGRLVLADAMAWAIAQYRPELVIDVATLTGAATLGLGKRHAALYGTDEALTAALQAAGDATGEPMWPMPLVADYRHALDSPIADLCHVNTDPHTRAGSITAALFLQHFAGDVPWAHLDIAGPGRAPKTEHEIHEGPTGFTARALVHWLVTSTA